MRLSTDIDIIVEPGTDIECYIDEAARIFPFKRSEEQIRIGKNKVEKRHFKFIYDSPIRKSEFYILLDVVFTKNPYSSTICKEIKNEFLIVDGKKSIVRVPDPDCILGDKLTAFAPHTTGVPFGLDKELEIMKQFYDIATLSAIVKNQDAIVETYRKVVAEEIAYRGIDVSKEDVLRDTIHGAVCILGRGSLEAKEYSHYLKGIHSLDSHILHGRYGGETAACQACQVMYVASCLLTGNKVRMIDNTEKYMDFKLGKSKYKKLEYMKKLKLEAYGYLVEAVCLLEN